MSTSSVLAGAGSVAEVDNDRYHQFESIIRGRIASIQGPVFTTSASDVALWAAYLGNLPTNQQHYNCNCCRRFIQRYGGLVTIDETGRTRSVLWETDVPPFFAESVRALNILVINSRVNGVFLSSDGVWGWKQTDEWTHLYGVNPRVFKDRLLTDTQKMAALAEDFKTLSLGLSEFSLDVAKQALRVLEADALDRSEKTLGVAQWLVDLQTSMGLYKPNNRNLIWRAVATAPVGFTHIRSSMIGTLLEDIITGYSFETISKRWASKMHPLQYRRPTAPPKAGNIAEAEKLVAKLGIAKSLERRFARLDEVFAKLWVPKTSTVKPTEEGGVFGHLKAKKVSVTPLDIPATKITWEKFYKTIVPDALSIEVYCPPGSAPYFGLTTAVDSDAPPIIQWDGLEGKTRNPFAWYFHSSGSPADRWNLTVGWNQATAIFLAPNFWQEPEKFASHGKKVFFTIDGCRDIGYYSAARGGSRQGSNLFPEILKSELKGVDSVIEAHQKVSSLSGAETSDANGLAFCGPSIKVRVTSTSGRAEFLIDRFD